MVIPTAFDFRTLQTFALEHLIAFHSPSGDLRWAIAALTLRAFMSIWACGQRKCAQWVRNAARRIGQKAGLAAGLATADTMVAAGGG
jgi:hypothetical protein